MTQLDEKTAFSLITQYYNDPSEKLVVLATFLAVLEPLTREIFARLRVQADPAEVRSHATFAILAAFEECRRAGGASGFEEGFKRHLRSEVRDFTWPTGDVETPEDIPDKRQDPAAQYEIKEQVTLVREFLGNHYKPDAVEQFTRRFQYGDRLEDIATDYGISVSVLSEKFKPMLRRLRKYMKRLNGETDGA